jgi:lipid A ethanolaminephosphotransferase
MQVPNPARWRPELAPGTLAVAACVWLIATGNALFWDGALAGRGWSALSTWNFAASLFAALVAAHYLLIIAVINRYTVKPVLSFLLLASAFASYFMQRFNVFLDPDMMRNVMNTDAKETGELLSWEMLPYVALHAGPPLLLLWLVRIKRPPLVRSLVLRLISVTIAVLVMVGGLIHVFQDFSGLMRNDKMLRYRLVPGNYVFSLGFNLVSSGQVLNQTREPIGPDAKLSDAMRQRVKPVLFVLVVGETARAANWGLNGYSRQTTPELAALDVVNFSNVTSCGTNTEVSLPCMFSVLGRRHYDQATILRQESLLNVLQRAGLHVLWRDNQSGCKGVCTGITTEQLDSAKVPGLCTDGRCFDEILLNDLDSIARDNQGNLLVVLHQLGNHGPAYHRRVPPEFARFQPACNTSELHKCSQPDIVNAYDNALLYTDHVLAKTIAFLKAQERYDTALLYVSDHGESLGESGLFLHGIPYAIAPKEQTHVPMILWTSPGYAASMKLDRDCLRQRANQPASHDNLFHTLLGMLGVQTSLYEAGMDLTAGCR